MYSGCVPLGSRSVGREEHDSGPRDLLPRGLGAVRHPGRGRQQEVPAARVAGGGAGLRGQVCMVLTFCTQCDTHFITIAKLIYRASCGQLK